MLKSVSKWLLLSLVSFIPSVSLATDLSLLKNTSSNWPAITTFIIFVIAYLLVMSEEFLHLRKSKPMVLAAGIIWCIIAVVAKQQGVSAAMDTALRHNLLEYAELFLFLLVAMTYISAMEDRQVFDALQGWLVGLGISYRSLFWITGCLAFLISPLADNLTTALIMCTVLLSVGRDEPKFISIGCINIVVAANSGGAFSPFGDLTTLMVWQSGMIAFEDFFKIFFPALVSFVVPAMCMHFAIPKGQPKMIQQTKSMLFGAKRLVALFLLTIATVICFHNYLHLPAVIGMMTGLGYLQFFGYYLKRKQRATINRSGKVLDVAEFDVFKKVQRAEWDTLLFFYGVILCVGGLATLGLLEAASTYLYQDLGAQLSPLHQQTPANVIIGLLSAIVDNIPVMFAVLTMDPHMSEGQWLLVTLTAGIGGSLLSIGSAAGVALMGQARGMYTFFSHLKWSWAIALGYVASIVTHLWWNKSTFALNLS